MQLKPEEISKVIRSQIKYYDNAIRQDETGELYGEAVDPAFAGRTYTETDIPAEDEATAEEILDILLGGDGG